MDKAEAKSLLRAHLGQYRNRSYSELMALLSREETTELEGPSGIRYQVEIQVFWDDSVGGCLRVLGSIDDGGCGPSVR